MIRNIKSNILLGTLLLLFTFSVRVATAQQQSSGALSLEECITLAKSYNKSIKAAESQKRYSEHLKKEMRANFFPSISAYARGFYTTIEDDYSLKDIDFGGVVAKYPQLQPYLEKLMASPLFAPLSELIHFEYSLDWTFMGGVSLMQPIYMGGKVRSGFKLAKLAGLMAEQNLRLTESQVIVETSKAYANVVKANEMKVVAQRYHSLLQKLMKDVESAYKNGVKSKNDLLKVQVKLNESLLNVKKAENAHKLATMNLCHYIGKPLTERVEVNGTLPEYDGGIKGEPLLTNRPEYAMYDYKEQMAKQQVNLERSNRLPQLGLMAQYGYTAGLKLYGKNFFNDASFMAGVNLTVPLFTFGGKSNKTKGAKAQYEQVSYERENVNEMILLEVTQAANNYDESLLELEIAESSLRAADENLRMSDKQYLAGIEPLSDLLEAQLMWQQAYQAHIDAKNGAFVNWLEYKKAIGELN